MEIEHGGHKVAVSDSTPVMTYEQWKAEGERRFGKNLFQWKFKCPVCGHVASPEDFRPYKDQGATPESACVECIGRYDGTNRAAFAAGDVEKKGFKKGGPCDYALYGLFRLPGVVVTGSPYAKDGKPMMAFAFAEVDPPKGATHESDGK